MAVEFIEAVYRLPDITSTEVLVLGYLANKSNAEGESWPSRSTIAAACRLHPDTVKSILQGLALRNLIGKESRYHDGRQTSNRIVLKFGPARRAEGVGGGDIPPTDRVHDPRTQGVNHSLTPGAVHPLEEPSEEPSKEESVARWAEKIWNEAPLESRKKSTTKAQTYDALLSAKRRGHDLARVAEGVRLYFEDPDHRRDKCRAMKGVHRIVQNDLWETWAPPTGWVPPAAPEAGAELSTTVPAALGTMDAPAEYVQRVWMQDWVDSPFKWQEHVRGPQPGDHGCRICPAIQAEFGVTAAEAAPE